MPKTKKKFCVTYFDPKTKYFSTFEDAQKFAKTVDQPEITESDEIIRIWKKTQPESE